MTAPKRLKTPAGYLSSVKTRAKKAAAENGCSTTELMDLHFHRRLIARVFDGPNAQDWVLKGGQALLIRWPKARASTDIDFLGNQDTVDDAVTALIAAATLHLDDDIWFRHQDTSTPVQVDRPTRKVKFKVMFGNADLNRIVSVDVVASGHLPGGQITTEPLEPAFDMDCAPWPPVRVYPIEDHIADKICAMYERHGVTGTKSTRYKDLVDLVLFALKVQVPGDLTHRVLRDEASRRQQRDGHTTLELPTRFHVPDEPTWASGYAKSAKDVAELSPDLRQFTHAAALADAFITPLLAPKPPQGIWAPASRAWL